MQNEERINGLETQVRTLKRIICLVSFLIFALIHIGCASSQNVKQQPTPATDRDSFGRHPDGKMRYTQSQAEVMQRDSNRILASISTVLTGWYLHTTGATLPIWDARTNEQFEGTYWDVTWMPDSKLINIRDPKIRKIDHGGGRVATGVTTKVLFIWEIDNYGRPSLVKTCIADAAKQTGRDMLHVSTGTADYAMKLMSEYSLRLPLLEQYSGNDLYMSQLYQIVPGTITFSAEKLKRYFDKHDNGRATPTWNQY